MHCCLHGQLLKGKITGLRVKKEVVQVSSDINSNDDGHTMEFLYKLITPYSEDDSVCSSVDAYKTDKNGLKFLPHIGLSVMIVGHKESYYGKITMMKNRTCTVDFDNGSRFLMVQYCSLIPMCSDMPRQKGVRSDPIRYQASQPKKKHYMSGVADIGA